MHLFLMFWESKSNSKNLSYPPAGGLVFGYLFIGIYLYFVPDLIGDCYLEFFANNYTKPYFNEK